MKPIIFNIFHVTLFDTNTSVHLPFSCCLTHKTYNKDNFDTD